MGTDRSDPPYRALGLLLPQNPTTRPRDQILSSGDFSGEVGYTQANPFVGVPTPSADNAGRMVLEATGELAEPFAENIEAIALQAGMPAPAGGARLGWRYETASRYHGWEPPSTLSGYEAIEWTDGSVSYTVRETSRPHAIGLPDGGLVVAYQDRYVLGPTTLYRVRVATRDASTGAWSQVTVYSSASAPSTAGSGGGFFPCLWRVEAQSYAQGGVAGVVYLAHWVEEGSSPAQGNLRVYSSVDGGTTWVTQTLRALREDVPLGTSAGQYIPGRLRIQSQRGTAMLVMALTNNRSTGFTRNIFAQYAAPDEGVDFRQIALWDEAATSPVEGGRYHDLVITAGRYLLVYCTLDGGVGQGRAAYRYVSNAWEDLRNVAEIAVDVDGSSNVWASYTSTGGVQLTDGDLAAVLLPDQSIWVFGRETGSGVSNDECGVFMARNIFEPFEPVGFGRASGSAYAHWWSARSSSTYPAGFCAAHQGGRVVVVTNHAANPGDEDGSLSALYLGGWSDAPLPGYTASPRPTKRMAWEFNYLPWDLPTHASWSQTVGGTYTTTLDSPGHLAVVASGLGGRAYFSRVVTAPRLTGMVMMVELRVNSGGTLVSDAVFLRLGVTTSSSGNDVSVRVSSTQVQLYDNLGSALLGSAVSLPNPGGWNQILFAVAGNTASAWIRGSDVPTESREWTEIASGVSVTQGTLASALARWGVGGPGNVVADADFRLVGLTDSTSVGQAPYDLAPGLNAEAVFGGPIGTTFFPLGAGGGAARYAAKTGPARAGDAWTIATDYEHPARNAHPLVKTTPRTGWRSSTDADEATLAMRASSSTGDTAIPRDLLVAACFNIEQRTMILEGRQTASGLWTELATLDACGQGASATAGLSYILTGDTLIPDTTAASATTPWLHAGDYVGGYVDLGGGKLRRIYAQTGGLWADSSTTPPVLQPVLHLEGIDGSESATGACDIWSPRVAAIVDVADVRWQALRLRIETQDTPNARFAIGTWFLGYVLTFGQPYGWGRGISQESGAVIEELEDGQTMVYQAKPARRAVSLAWDPIETSTLDEGGDYIQGAPAVPPRAIASPQATGDDLMGLLEATAQGKQPVLYLPRVEPTGAPTGQILTSRHDLWLARISDGPAFTAELGDESEDEMIAATLTLREEV